MKLRNKKTGEIFDAIIREKGGGDTYSIIVCNIEEYSKPPLARCILGEYDSLAKLYEEWEDYKPAEPLIKDEKIRKAVRAWADFNHPHELFVVSVDRIVDEKNNEIKFSGQPFCGLVSMQPTITELCGEEEEC